MKLDFLKTLLVLWLAKQQPTFLKSFMPPESKKPLPRKGTEQAGRRWRSLTQLLKNTCGSWTLKCPWASGGGRVRCAHTETLHSHAFTHLSIHIAHLCKVSAHSLHNALFDMFRILVKIIYVQYAINTSSIFSSPTVKQNEAHLW